ncbi:MAG TPA: GNAT family N-acetyltransferase [Rhodanobacteraceae bacterium]|nr:GNAT family N-acetyltransferase [Rhodanobacteraceae bacterium]
MTTVQTRHPPSIRISRATLADLDAVTPLFDAYRVFYQQASDRDGARAFLRARFEHHESEIFLARDATDGLALGFAQLYPSFSSVSARRTWIVNDLFVATEARKRGVARALMAAAREFGRVSGAIRLNLETADDNHAAQALYESLGYHRDTGMRHYSLPLD